MSQPGPTLQHIGSHAAIVGQGMPIHRALPSQLRRMVGPWCFLDHIGPADIGASGPLRVGPHPHIGLQTVTWLRQGEILHRDSLGSLQTIRPGQLNVMTSGRAISHSEESPADAPAPLHGVQFWTALPDSARHSEPLFDHHPALPMVDRLGLRITVVAGEALGERSPARAFWPIVGLDLTAADAFATELPLRPDFEYAVLAMTGDIVAAGAPVAPDTLLYLGTGRSQISLGSAGPAQFMLIGGQPFEALILMWWNFVGRSRDEITRACLDWNAGGGAFGEVQGYDGARLQAPLPPWMQSG